MSFIENLQKRPKKTRVLILWMASICVMIIILLIWLFSFSFNLKAKNIKQNVEDTKLPSLFESINRDFSLIKQSLQAGFKNIKDKINEGEAGQQ